MRRHLNLLIALMIVLVFGLAGAAEVSAAAGQGSAGLEFNKNGGMTISNSRVVKKADQKEYMEGAALVMYRTSSGLSKKGVRAELRGGEEAVEDAQVEDLWNFDVDPGTTLSNEGVRKAWTRGASAGSNCTVALVKSKTLSTEQLIAKLRKQDGVVCAEPNWRVHAYDVDDPYFKVQWGMQGGSAGSPEYDPNTPNVEEIWNKGTTGSNRIVAVVDTGVDYTHPDLAACMWKNTHQDSLKGKYGYDFISGDADPLDENGHGTHCAGIIGAQGNNGIGVCGVNQGLRIMALRTLDAEGSSWMSHEIAAYNYINKAMSLGEPVQAINNSWGGGEDSEIFAALIDIVGKKGAVTVCAAGNSSLDNDVYADYPSYIRSPYMISVAATTWKNELASFSNYGKDTVDVAAPGTDILSTVPYYSYNPTIYDEAKRESLTAAFNNYDPDSGELGSIDTLRENLYLNGEKYEAGGSKPQITIDLCEGGFHDDAGHAAQINIRKMKAGDLVCMAIPYEISMDAKTLPHFSVMAQCAGTTSDTGILGLVDLMQGEDLGMGTIGEIYLDGSMFTSRGTLDRWSHQSFETLSMEDLDDAKEESAWIREEAARTGEEPEFDPLKREIVILAYAYEARNMTIRLDDMGMSREDLEGPGDFEQYDFMSGTSMATPFISGAVALQAAADGKSFNKNAAEDLTSRIISLSKEGDMPVLARGSFDFTRIPAELPPRISSIKVDKSGGKITINGTGLKPSNGLQVQIGPSEEELKTATIVSQTDKKVVVKDNNWINNLEIVRVTGFNDRTSSRSNQYLVDGKKKYTMVSGSEDETTTEAMATNGKTVYNLDSSDGKIYKIYKSNGNRKRLATVKAKKIFGKAVNANKNAVYMMKFGDDLVYLKGKLYTVVEYGEADLSEDDADYYDFYARESTQNRGEEYYVFDDEEEEGTMAMYTTMKRLISIDVKTGKVKNLGSLPKELQNSQDYAMAAYKGKIYFIGGYSYATDKPTTVVKTYTPAKVTKAKKGKKSKKKKAARWKNGAKLPAIRAGGEAVVSDGKLIYTMGYTGPLPAGEEVVSYQFPPNLVFNGKSWTVSKASGANGIASMMIDETEILDGKAYPKFSACVSAVKGGLIYIGMPAANLGDTFTYSLKSDRFYDSGYNFISDLYDQEIHGIVVKKVLYGFDGEKMYKVKLK